MKLEQQVVSLALAKKLKELGVKQESYFYWIKDFDEQKGWRIISRGEICGELDAHYGFGPDEAKEDGFVMYSAFTVAELGEMLPQLEHENEWYVPVSYRFTNEPPSYECELLHRKMLKPSLHKTVEMNEADARAKMLIYLIENNLIEPLRHPAAP